MAGYKDLLAYQKAKQVADQIFEITMAFPADEKYSLTDQIRRSSRSVCACIAEAYRKRKYPAHFVSKLTDADMENTETEVWLDFAKDYKYMALEKHQSIALLNSEVGKLLSFMIDNPDKFINHS
jgi:four helix bundle protein